VADEAGSGAALGDHLFDAGLAHADECELGGDEEAIAENQHDNRGDAEEQEFEH
jgi:hypothetical protein